MDIFQIYEGRAVSWKGRNLFIKKFWTDMGMKYFILKDASGMECGVYVPQDEITLR